MPELTQGSIQQLLDVLAHVQANHVRGVPMPTAYHDAVRDVASRHRVTYQTIADFRRRLGFADAGVYVALIDRWLRGDGTALRDAIKLHATPSARSLVDQFFSKQHVPASTLQTGSTARKPSPSAITSVRLEELRIRVPPELSQRLNLAHMARIRSTLEETAIALLEAGFDATKPRIRSFLDATVGAT